MKFLRDDEVPAPPAVKEYRETQWASLITGGVALAAAAAILIWPALEAGWDAAWVYLILVPAALCLLLMTRFAFKSFAASLRGGNWRLRWSPDALYIRYRSYLNEHYPADEPTVLRLGRREVHALSAGGQSLSASDQDGGWSGRKRQRWLEVGLRRVDTEPIAAALASEYRPRRAPGWQAKDYPVTLTPKGALRIALLRPKAVIDRLRTLYAVAAPVEVAGKDFQDMTQEEKEAHIRDLALAGETMSAVAAAREVHGFDLTAARRFVGALQGEDAEERSDA